MIPNCTNRQKKIIRIVLKKAFDLSELSDYKEFSETIKKQYRKHKFTALKIAMILVLKENGLKINQISKVIENRNETINRLIRMSNYQKTDLTEIIRNKVTSRNIYLIKYPN